MAAIERLVTSYERFVRLPWDAAIAGPQKVWFAVYAPSEERRLRARIGAFATATIEAGYEWKLCDLTDCFANWMASQEYRESYFEAPEDMEIALDEFGHVAVETVREHLAAPEVNERTVVAVSGVAAVFGLMRVSRLVEAVAPSVQGRLLVFFPGERDGPNYRLLDARDGWNYLAVPITAADQ